MLKGWDRFCLYNIKIRRHCQLYVKLLFKLFKGLNFFKSWKLLLMKKIYRLKPNWRFSHSTMPSKKQPPFWSPVPVIPELAALVSGYPPHLNPRRGPASHPRGELGAVMQRGAGARSEERGNYNIKWVLLLSYHSHGIETCHLNLNSKSRRQPFIFIIVKVVFQPIIIKKHFSSQNITVGKTSDFCWPQNDKQWI